MGAKDHRRSGLGFGLAALLSTVAAPAVAQSVQPDPPPPQPDTTTHVEQVVPIADEPVMGDDPAAPKKKEKVAHEVGEVPLTELRTDNLSLLYFDPVQTYLTPYLARSFENALAAHKKRFDWTPWERTSVLLKDFGDSGNAAARSSPNNAVLLDVAPISLSLETFTPGERFFTLINHELAHVATMDVWNKQDAGWRKIFAGKPMPIQEHPESILYNYLATPRNSVPRWYLEGSAVFFETWMAGGLGRAQGGYDEMVFRAKVRDGDKFYSPLGLESAGTAVDFQVGVNDYLYGTRFISWLALTYGPDKLVQWLKREEGSAGFYASAFRQTYGLKLDDAWDQWIAFEHSFQKSNLAKVGQYPLTETTPLSSFGLGSMSRGYVDTRTNSLLAAVRYPGQIGYLGMMDLATGKLRRLTEIKGMMLYKVTSLAFDPDARKAYYTEDNYAFRDILEIDVDTGKKRKLLKDARIGDIVLNPADKSIWGIRHQNGYATLVRIPPPYAGFNQIHTFEYGEIPFDLDISPDGSLISASYGEVDGKQSVRVWKLAELQAGGGPEEVGKLELPPSTPESFTFSPDGKSLYGTSYYSGVSNVFRFDIESGKYDVLTNASTGFFRPMLQPDGQMLVYEYTGAGMTPALIQPQVREDLAPIEFLGTRVIKTHPSLKDWGVGSPAGIDLNSRIRSTDAYLPGKQLKLAAAYPIVEGYLGKVSPGWFLHWEDPMQFRQIDLALSVSPIGDLPFGQRVHVDAEYKMLKWKFRYWHNDADIYDLAGPVKRSRKGDAGIVRYEKTLIYDTPRQLDFHASAAAYFGLEQLPSAQNVLSPANIQSLEAGLHYTNTRKALGGVDHEKGLEARLSGGVDSASGDRFPHLQAGFDYGVPLPWGNSSFWIYNHAGWNGGPAGSPLGSMYLGSFRNNYVDNRPEKRYREFDSFPGFDIDEIASRRLVKSTAEVNLPPIRFEEVGTPAFFLKYLRPAAFGGAMLSRGPDGRNYRLFDVGAQVDLAFTVAMRLPMTLSLGVAKGFGDKEIKGDLEWLASLKIM